MCGICGLVGIADHNLLRNMCNSIIHRGPDSEGYYEDDSISLGVRRLRIIDLKTGDQPIHNEDSSIWIVFNGEIYNFRELRSFLEERGHEFYTRTDTEVLVHLYEEYKEEMLKYLRGMFAFALYDSKEKVLFLARDRFGEKPLYYTFNKEYFIFASELKAILAFEEIKRKINKKALAYYLHYFYNPLKESFIEGIYRLEPASYLKYYLRKKSFEIKEYWDINYKEIEIDEENLLNKMDELIRESVKTKLISDVPIGVLLSGGVDSSVVATIASNYSKEIEAYTVSFPYNESEERYAKMVAEKFGIKHRIKHVEKIEIENIIDYLDEPIGDSSIIPTYIISKVMKENLTVCLTGEGGDELFWGYPWLQERDMLDAWFKIPSMIRKPTMKIMKIFPKFNSIITDLERYEKLNYKKLNDYEKTIARLSHFTKEEIRDMLNEDYDCNEEYINTMRVVNNIRKSRAYLTIKKVLVNDYLHKDDRLSMANSMEFRASFLDHLLAEFTFTLPMKYFKEPKYLLKKYAFQKLGIPKEVIYRKKVGFAFPVQKFSKEIRDRLEDNLKILRKFINIKEIKAIPSYEYSNRNFALLVLARWLDKYECEC